MSEDSDTTAPCSEENIDDEDFANILKGIGMSKAEENKIKDECGHWHTLISDSINEMTKNLLPTCDRKITEHLEFIRFYIESETASMHDIENLTTAPSK